jgi:hypothetical protein
MKRSSTKKTLLIAILITVMLSNSSLQINENLKAISGTQSN